MQRSGRNQLHARFTLLRTLARDVCLNGTNRRVPFNSSSPRQNCDRCRDVYQPVKSSRLFNGLEWWDFIPERTRLPACRRTRADRVAFFSGGKSKASVWVLFPVAGFVSTDQHLPSGRAERTVCSVSAADIYYWIPSLSVLVYWASRMGTMSPLCVATMLFKSTFVHWLRMFFKKKKNSLKIKCKHLEACGYRKLFYWAVGWCDEAELLGFLCYMNLLHFK